MNLLNNILRTIIGLTNLGFGVLKVFGMHMSNSDINISEISNINSPKTVFWFFGHSGIYVWTAGLMQVLSGVMTIVPKTSLIGVVLSLGIYVNIALINYSFHFGTLISVYVLLMTAICLYLLFLDRHKLSGLLK